MACCNEDTCEECSGDSETWLRHVSFSHAPYSVIHESLNLQPSPHTKRSGKHRLNFAPSYQTKLDQFRRAFKSEEIDTERLLVDYSCAFYNNGLITQGRMFITEEYVCFYSKLIYEFKLVLDVRKIVAITKEKTAKFIPNAIQFVYAPVSGDTSDNSRYFFTSFAARERTYAILLKIWENGKSHQSMSMDEIIRQVREMYGDHSADQMMEPLASSSPNKTKNEDDSECQPTSTCVSDQYLTRRSSWIDPQSKSDRSRISMKLVVENGNLSDGLFNSQSPAVVSTSAENASASSASPAIEGPRSRAASSGPIPRKTSTKQNYHGALREDDESDTTEESEYGEISPIRPQVAEVFAGPAVCEHNHEGRSYLDAEFSIGIDALFKCIFTDCQFNRDFLELRGTTEFKADVWSSLPWEEQHRKKADENPVRNLSYVVALKQKVGPRSCLTMERQTLINSESMMHRRYVVDTRINNENVPLCTSFHVECRYCLLSINKHNTRLRVHSRIAYDEKVFFAVKNIIESTCRTNTAESFNDMADLLKQRSCRLSRSEKIHGGPLVKAPEVDEKRSSTKASSRSVGGLEGTAIPINRPTNLRRDDPNHQSKIFQIPRSDRDWLIIIAISVLLCLCLSMLYSRFLQLEEMATQFNTGPHISGPCPSSIGLPTGDRHNVEMSLEIKKMRTTIEALGTVMEEVGNAVKTLDKRLMALQDAYSRFKATSEPMEA